MGLPVSAGVGCRYGSSVENLISYNSKSCRMMTRRRFSWAGV